MGQSKVQAESRGKSAALDKWHEQESAFLADFVPLTGVGSDRSPRFRPGWWIVPTLGASAIVWAGVVSLLL